MKDYTVIDIKAEDGKFPERLIIKGERKHVISLLITSILIEKDRDFYDVDDEYFFNNIVVDGMLNAYVKNKDLPIDENARNKDIVIGENK